MGHIVKMVDGHMVYDGLLSSKEIATVQDILQTLKEEIPSIEADLNEEYGQSVWYKYNLGLFLGHLLEKYEIPYSEQREFWNEIKQFATNENRQRNEGSKAATRSFYHQCYVLSLQSKDVVEKLSWRQWQDLLDRVENRKDERIFQWLAQTKGKIRESDWRGFEKALNLYLKNKDTSVFETDELFVIYDSLMFMSKRWQTLFKQFSIDHPKSAKLSSKAKWEKKYYASCFEEKKAQRSQIVTEKICDITFAKVMN